MHDSMARYPPPSCHPKTREKVMKVIRDWVERSNPHQPIKWLNGPAGAGKSAIAQSIADHYKDSRLAASFFFQRGTPDRGVADRLCLTLAWQLAGSIPETRSYIEHELETEGLLNTKSIDVQFDHLIVKVFKNLLRDRPDLRPEKSLIIIDGVDECASERDQKLLLELIGNSVVHGKIPLRFLICSRPEPHIEERFDAEAVTNLVHSVVLDERFAPNDDIQRYLEAELWNIFTKNVSPHPSPAEIQRLVSKSSGQFIYASTAIKFISDDNFNPRTQLDIILKLRPASTSAPFAELDQLYVQVLSQQPDTKLLRDVFALIIGLGQPDINFICRRLQITKDELLRKLRRMHSLLNISDSNIEVYHRSLHDFFQDRRRAGRYYIHPARVKLVRLPRNVRRFAARWGPVLGSMVFALAKLLLLVPFLVVPAICVGLITCYKDLDFCSGGIRVLLFPFDAGHVP